MRSYGRKPGLNPKFELRRFTADTSKSFPASLSYEMFAPAAYDQGAYGTCVANGSIGVFRTYHKKRGFGDAVASRSALYSQAKHAFEPDDIADDGLQVTDGLLVMKDFGFAMEDEWPYPDDPSGQNTGNLLESVPANLWHRSFLEASYLAVDMSSPESIMRAMSEHGPIIIGMNFPLEWENIGPDGFMDPEIAQTSAGGHCIWIPAYDEGRFGGAVKVRNSWGKPWGDNGDGWLPFSCIQKNPTFWPDEGYTVSFPKTA
jgi:hypothetical protein